MLKKGDVFLLAAIVVITAASFAGVKLYRTNDAGVHKIAIIKQNEKVIRRIDLDAVKQSERIKVGGDYEEVVLVENGKIRFEEANCPDQVCVKTGWLNKTGDTAVCLPNRTIIKIEGEKEELDSVAF